MHHIVFKFACYLVSDPSYVVCPWFFFFLCFLLLDMASKPSGKFKTRAKRTLGSSSSSDSAVGVWFLTGKCEETYETLNKYRSIWGERKIVLSELDPSIHRTFMARNLVSLCEVCEPPPAALIREFTLTSLSILRLPVVIT